MSMLQGEIRSLQAEKAEWLQQGQTASKTAAKAAAQAAEAQTELQRLTASVQQAQQELADLARFVTCISKSM